MRTMGEIETAELAAYCGLYCGACAIENGQIRNTAKALQGMLKAYGYPQWAPTLAEFVPATKHYPEFDGVLEWLTTQECGGCLAGGGNPQCAIRICAREKGLAGCWECTEVACEKLQGIDQGYPGASENRQHIREMGLEAWVAEQAAKVEAGFSYLDVLSGSE
jgi:hypothetical protein